MGTAANNGWHRSPKSVEEELKIRSCIGIVGSYLASALSFKAALTALDCFRGTVFLVRRAFYLLLKG